MSAVRIPLKLASLLALGGLLLCLAPASLAQPGPPGGGIGPPPGEGRGRGPGPPPFEDLLERHAGRLGLDAATLEKIRAARDATRDEMRRLDGDVRRLRDALRALLEADAPKLEAVLAQADAIGAAETARQKERLRTLLAIRALLTPEQRAELVKIHEEMRRERGKPPRPGGPPPEPGGAPFPGPHGPGPEGEPPPPPDDL